jgi:hypothetical protein
MRTSPHWMILRSRFQPLDGVVGGIDSRRNYFDLSGYV